MALAYTGGSGGGGGGGGVKSVTAGDTSIVVGGTATDPTIETADLATIAADHATAGDVSLNGHKGTNAANGTAATDLATVGQLPVMGKQLDYVEITTTVVITATADGNGGGTAVLNGDAVTYDGATTIIVTVSVPRLTMTAAIAGHSVYLNLYDGTNDLGRMAQAANAVAGVSGSWPVFEQRLLTPSAGSHTFNIRGWKDSSSDVTGVICGAGGASTLMPAYMRVTVA